MGQSRGAREGRREGSKRRREGGEREREGQIYNIDWQIKCHSQRPRRSIPISHWYKTRRLVRPRIWSPPLKKNKTAMPDYLHQSKTMMKYTHVQLSPFIRVKSHSISPPRSNVVVCSSGFKWCSEPGFAAVSDSKGLSCDWSQIGYRFQAIVDQKGPNEQTEGKSPLVLPRSRSNLWSTVWIKQVSAPLFVCLSLLPPHISGRFLQIISCPPFFTVESEYGTTVLRAQFFISDLSA